MAWYFWVLLIFAGIAAAAWILGYFGGEDAPSRNEGRKDPAKPGKK